MFADINDSDTWHGYQTRKIFTGIHLQQTNNTASMHKDFTETNNKNGLLPGQVAKITIWNVYNNQNENDMPPPVENIYLTLSFFIPRWRAVMKY